MKFNTGKLHYDFSGLKKLPEEPSYIFVGKEDLFCQNMNYDKVLNLASSAIANEQHEFIFLSRHATRMAGFFTDLNPSYIPKNIVLMVIAEDQNTVNERVPVLLSILGGWKRGLSIEPMSGHVDLTCINYTPAMDDQAYNALTGFGIQQDAQEYPDYTRNGAKLDWVICAGGNDPIYPGWPRSLRDQCIEACVPFFFNGWGEYGPTAYNYLHHQESFRTFENFNHYCNKAPTWMLPGDKLICPDGHVPTHGGENRKTFPMCVVRRLGKKRSGCLLDGREWSEVPE